MAFRTTFKAIGSGSFPLDMLRYDTCYPLEENDARSLLEEWPHDPPSEIYLQTWHAQKSQPHLTPRRWQSFGWRIVVEAEARDDMKLGTQKV